METFEQILRDGSDALLEGDEIVSLERAREALRRRPGNPLAENLLGMALFAQRRFSEAQAVFEGLVRRNPDVVSLRVNAGMTALRNDNERRAQGHFTRALALRPSHKRALAYLALLHVKREDNDNALPLLQRGGFEELAFRLDQPMEEDAALWFVMDLQAAAFDAPGMEEDDSSPLLPHEGFCEIRPVVVSDDDAEPSDAEPSDEADDALTEPDDFDDAPNTAPPPEAAHRPSGPGWTRVGGPGHRVTGPHLPVMRGSSQMTGPHLPVGGISRVSVSEFGPDAMGSFVQARADLPIPVRKLSPLNREGGPPASMSNGLVMLRLGELTSDSDPDGAYVRHPRVMLSQGDLSWAPARRKRKGKLDEPFEVEGEAITQVTGTGFLLLFPDFGEQLRLLRLDNDALYLREQHICAFSSALHWENGRIPGMGQQSPSIIQLRGEGYVTLHGPDVLQAVAVQEEFSLTVGLDHLVGWTGEVIPRPERNSPITGDVQVTCSGVGLVLVGHPQIGPGSPTWQVSG